MFYGCNLTPRFSPTAAASPDTDDVGRRAGRAGERTAIVIATTVVERPR